MLAYARFQGAPSGGVRNAAFLQRGRRRVLCDPALEHVDEVLRILRVSGRPIGLAHRGPVFESVQAVRPIVDALVPIDVVVKNLWDCDEVQLAPQYLVRAGPEACEPARLLVFDLDDFAAIRLGPEPVGRRSRRKMLGPSALGGRPILNCRSRLDGCQFGACEVQRAEECCFIGIANGFGATPSANALPSNAERSG